MTIELLLFPPLQCDEFDQKIEILYGRMAVKVINMLHPFLTFAKCFSQERTHNSVALMLGPHFKGIDCIMDYIDRDQAAILMQKYDELIVMPLLKAMMGFLNPDQVASSILPSPELPPTSTRLCGLASSTQEATKGLPKAELSLFHRFNVENVDGLNPLIYWFVNESMFSNVGILA
jgi:hypothetical protein